MGGVFKNIFGKKNESNETNQLLNEYKNIPWMTESRLDVLSICLKNGFKPASSLPTEFEKKLRTSIEIAKRLNAIKAIVLWLMVSKDELPDKKIQYFIKTNELEVFLTEEEKLILMNSREDEDARNSIGWKFENAWSLAWYFGYDEPEIFGNMMSGEKMSEILMNFTCPLDEKIEEWIKTKKIVSEEMVLKKEDLFYCLHNAVRSAQLGRKTVPLNFDPIMNGGVIHERRHSLTWMVSKDIDWDETDLST